MPYIIALLGQRLLYIHETWYMVPHLMQCVEKAAMRIDNVPPRRACHLLAPVWTGELFALALVGGTFGRHACSTDLVTGACL